MARAGVLIWVTIRIITYGYLQLYLLSCMILQVGFKLTRRKTFSQIPRGLQEGFTVSHSAFESSNRFPHKKTVQPNSSRSLGCGELREIGAGGGDRV